MLTSRWRLAALVAFLPLLSNAHAERRDVSRLFQPADIQRITLDQAISMALQNNLEARIDRLDIRVQRSRVRFEVGAFDPALSLNFNRGSVNRPENINEIRSTDVLRQDRQVTAIEENTNAIRGLQGLPPITRNDTTTGLSGVTFEQQTQQTGGSLVGRTPWGMRYGFFTEANRLRSTFTGDERDVVPTYQTSVGIQVLQPLLKDFGPAANLAPLRIARINERISVMNWRQRVMTSVQTVMATYYEMLYAVADLAVRQDAIAASNTLVQQNQRRMELGFMSPIDVQQARAQVSTEEEQLLTSKNVFMERQFALKRLLIDDFQKGDPRLFYPANVPNLTVPKINRSAFLSEAFARRYDYQTALLEADAQDIRLRFARNQALPQLDLVTTYSLNGLSDRFGDAFDQSFRGASPEWSVGVNFRFPLGNIQGRGDPRAGPGAKGAGDSPHPADRDQRRDRRRHRNQPDRDEPAARDHRAKHHGSV
jgi:outer membrane protein TolC